MSEINITGKLAQRASSLRYEDLSPAALTLAKQCLLDWMAVTIAGRDEELVRILLDERMDAGLAGTSTVVGRTERLALPAAVLVNGSMSHALDYDDVSPVSGVLLGGRDQRMTVAVDVTPVG